MSDRSWHLSELCTRVQIKLPLNWRLLNVFKLNIPAWHSEVTELERQSTHWWLLIGWRVLPHRGYTVTSWVGAPAYAAVCGQDYFKPKHCLRAREVLLHQRPNKHRARSVNQQQVWLQLPGDCHRRQADWEHTCLFRGWAGILIKNALFMVKIVQ